MSISLSLTVDELYEKLRPIQVDNPLCTYTYERCAQLLPIINEILELKETKNALILAHSYVHPDIVFGVADYVGDSYELSKRAKEANEDLIVFPAVRFMAETAKIINPQKKVIDPNPNGGCSLADSITAEEVYELRKLYPEHMFVCYINTTAAVKAACDVCVTSSNMYRILERLPTDKIYFLPDKFLGENGKRHLEKKGIDKEVLTYPGSCYVHEQFDADTVDAMRSREKDLVVIAHPECKPEVVAKADVVGSTTEMIRYVKTDENRKFLLLTECGVASRLQIEAPKARFVGGCMLCRFMRSNSLQAIRDALKNPIHEITIDQTIIEKARLTLERMFIYAE